MNEPAHDTWTQVRIRTEFHLVRPDSTLTLCGITLPDDIHRTQVDVERLHKYAARTMALDCVDCGKTIASLTRGSM